MTVHATDPAASTVAATASKFQFAGAGGAITGGLLSSEMGVLVGIIIGVVGGLVSWHYRRKEDQRRQEMHDLKVEILRKGEDIPPEAGSTLT